MVGTPEHYFCIIDLFALRGDGEWKRKFAAHAVAQVLIQKVTSHQSEIIHFLFFIKYIFNTDSDFSVGCPLDIWHKEQYMVCNTFFIFWRTHVLFCGAIDTFVLDFWWCLPWVSKPGWISLVCSLACKLFLRFASGATPADLPMASMAAHHVTFPTCIFQQRRDTWVWTGDLSLSKLMCYPLSHHDRVWYSNTQCMNRALKLFSYSSLSRKQFVLH